MDRLANEILVNICYHLNGRRFVSFGKTCTKYLKLIHDAKIWNSFVESEFDDTMSFIDYNRFPGATYNHYYNLYRSHTFRSSLSFETWSKECLVCGRMQNGRPKLACGWDSHFYIFGTDFSRQNTKFQKSRKDVQVSVVLGCIIANKFYNHTNVMINDFNTQIHYTVHGDLNEFDKIILESISRNPPLRKITHEEAKNGKLSNIQSNSDLLIQGNQPIRSSGKFPPQDFRQIRSTKRHHSKRIFVENRQRKTKSQTRYSSQHR